jgi:DNA-binding MarR family transcriptional regulator
MTSRTKIKARTAPDVDLKVGPQAAALFIALGAVLKQLRRTPLPRNPADRDAFQGALAPRHVEAWLQIAAADPITISDLAEKMQVTLATMSQVVGELDQMGVIQRAVDKTDRRRVFLFVTGAHREMLKATIERRMMPVQRTLDQLTEAEGATFIRGLQLLAREIDDSNHER